MKPIVQINSQYDIRIEIHQDKRYIVVPVVMMVEGVHSGNHGPLFHSAQELGRFPEAWNGTPVTIMHPEEDGRGVSANSPEIIDREVVGRVFNTFMDGDKLKGEVWLDEAVLIARNSEVLDYINSGRALDVSLGVFTDEETTPGVWNGEEYTAIASNHRPDHLALLPGEQGACSWADGCGIRNNSQTNKKGGDMSKTHEPWEIVLTNQTDYAELQNAVQNKLDSLDSGNEFHYLRALYDNEFVYEVRNHSGSIFYKRGYTVGGDGVVSFSEDKETVRRKVEFISTNASGGGITIIRSSNNKNKEEISMSEIKDPCCPEKVDALIANEASPFTSDDKETLLTMSGEFLAKLEPKEVDTPEKVETPQVNAESAREVLKGSIDNSDDLLPLLSDDMQEQVKSGIKLHKENRTNLIKSIQENSTEGTWTAEDLEGMNTEMLAKVYKSVNGVDYTALGINNEEVVINKEDSEEEPMLPTGMGLEIKTQK